MKIADWMLVGLFVFIASVVQSPDNTARAQATTPLQALVPDRNYEKEALALISHAENSIDVVQFEFFTESGPPQQILEALIARKKEVPDLKIRVLLEGKKNPRNALTR